MDYLILPNGFANRRADFEALTSTNWPPWTKILFSNL